MKTVLAIAAALLSAAAFSQKLQPDAAFQPSPKINVTKDIGLDQLLNHQVPLDAKFVDEDGKPVTLGSYFHKKPVLMALIYYKCPKLCNQVMNGILTALRMLNFDAGDQFQIVFVGIDPRESPAVAKAKKQNYLESYDRSGAEQGWHFLTGKKEDIDRVASAVGYRYKFDSSTGLYAHPAGVIVLTPEGKTAQYFYGIEYSPRDLKFAIMEASKERIGTVVDQVIFYCFAYDPETGKYGFVIMRAIRIGGILTLLAMGTLIFTLTRKGKHGHQTPSANGHEVQEK